MNRPVEGEVVGSGFRFDVCRGVWVLAVVGLDADVRNTPGSDVPGTGIRGAVVGIVVPNAPGELQDPEFGTPSVVWFPRVRCIRAVASFNRPARVSRVASAIPSCMFGMKMLSFSRVVVTLLMLIRASADPVRQRSLDRRARPEGAEHDDGIYRRQGQLGGHVFGDYRQPEDFYL